MAYRPNIKNADGTLTDLPLAAETAVDSINATKLKTARGIGLSGVTATAQSFNGTSDIAIPITSIPAALLTGTGNINITGNAATATGDGNGNNIAGTYLPKNNGTALGYLAVGDSKSKIIQNSISPNGHNIGVNGLMLTHNSNDEGGLLVNEDGAYLWNSTDSGSLLKGFDEDSWTANTGAKKDCTFANGLMFDFDSSGNLKIKGKFYQDNGGSTIGGGGVILWAGQSSSIDPVTFAYSDWKTRFSALLISLSGSNEKVLVAPIKDRTSNFVTESVSASFQANYDIVFYNFMVTVPMGSGNMYISQRYISWQSNTSSWSISTPSISIQQIVGII